MKVKSHGLGECHHSIGELCPELAYNINSAAKN
jgi:hypothetical protein